MKKIKLKKFVMVRMEKRKALVFDPETNLIIQFSKGMAKLVAVLFAQTDKKHGLELKDLQKAVAKPSRNQKITKKNVSDAIKLLAKFSLLEGRKGSFGGTGSHKRSWSASRKARNYIVQGLGIAIVFGGVELLASSVAQARSCAHCHTDCLATGGNMLGYTGPIYGHTSGGNTTGIIGHTCDCPIGGATYKSWPCT